MIVAEGLGYTFRGWNRKPVLHQINLHWPKGSVTGLLGLNGAGKTTLLSVLAGLREARTGLVRVAEGDPQTRSVALRRTVLLVPETTTLPRLSPQQLARRYAPFYPAFSEPEWTSLLADFQVPADRPLAQSSTGDQKKVHLAFALACRPQVLLLDEPTNALDIPSKMVLRKRLASYAAEGGTVVLSTHQVRELDHLFDRIAILHRGRLIIDQPRSVLEDSMEQRGEPQDWERYFAEQLEALDA